MKVYEQIDIVIPWVDGSDPEWQQEFKKYAAVAGLSAALTASLMSLYGNKNVIGDHGEISGFESVASYDPSDVISKTDVIEANKVAPSAQVLTTYNDYLKKHNSTAEFTIEELEDVSNTRNLIKVETENVENPYIIICNDYKLYKLNNEKLVALNPRLSDPVIDLLTGDEIRLNEYSDLVPICDVKSFIEDFEIPTIGYDFNKVSIRDEELEKITPDFAKQQAYKEIGLLAKVYRSV